MLGGDASKMGVLTVRNNSTTHDITNLTIQNCDFEYSGIFMIHLWGTSPPNASYLGPDLVTIDNCTFKSGGGYDIQGGIDPDWETVELGYHTRRVTISDCTFEDAMRHHIAYIGPESGSQSNKTLTVERCYFKGGNNNGRNWGQNDESSGIRLLGRSSNAIIKNSIFQGMYDYGIHWQGRITSTSLKVYNCTFAYNGAGGGDNKQHIRMLFVPDTAVELKGNIFWGMNGASNEHRHEIFINGALPGTGADINYNFFDSQVDGTGNENYPVYYNGTRYYWDSSDGSPAWQDLSIGGITPDQNSIEESFATDNNYPDFVDNQTDGTGDYHITSSSPLIEQGLSGLTTDDVDGDIRGSPADIGADEYAATSPDVNEAQSITEFNKMLMPIDVNLS
jgi:hypothetical protein